MHTAAAPALALSALLLLCSAQASKDNTARSTQTCQK